MEEGEEVLPTILATVPTTPQMFHQVTMEPLCAQIPTWGMARHTMRTERPSWTAVLRCSNSTTLHTTHWPRAAILWRPPPQLVIPLPKRAIIRHRWDIIHNWRPTIRHRRRQPQAIMCTRPREVTMLPAISLPHLAHILGNLLRYFFLKS